MSDDTSAFALQANHARYHGQVQGHYESFFLRANHPDRTLAFWIRYTIFSPRSCPGKARGELWAVFFNGEKGRHAAVKVDLPIQDCFFDTAKFHVRVGDAWLTSRGLSGAVYGASHAISWDLSYEGGQEPLLLLPEKLYSTKLPAAKSLVGQPMARFRGRVQVDGETIDIHDWTGSQNHNWGSKHTDLYAWGQVAGFDTHPESFLELATAKLKLGPFRSPAFTLVVLRHAGREYAANGLLQAVKARGAFDYFTWRFTSKTPLMEIDGTMTARPEDFVCLGYRNPPGGIKYCLNSKIASCRLRFSDLKEGISETLETRSRAAFEILTDDAGHGIFVSA
ncbi:MAG TPA: hypothetical protein PKM41_00990 [Deltaproteobacteria bacterium]|jgi:hypothetical protein|nr:hypothetical protein [Deltaproteobacteria bacterium]HOI06656.1 hypothetical protein [Deltaproteobacteria bacterium]